MEIYENLAAAHLQLDQPEAALDASERALALAPDGARALFFRGAALLTLNQSEAASAALERAMLRAAKLGDARPIYEGRSIDEAGRAMRATALAQQGEFEAAAGLIDEVLKDYPNIVDHWIVRGSIQTLANQWDLAIASYDKALALAPAAHKARFGRATLYMAGGDFDSAQADFAARLDFPKSHHCRASKAPVWTGREQISDARILVQGEQGYGDLFQFCRFVPMLARRGAKVVLHERPETFSLLKSLAGVENFIPNDAEPPATDWRVHLWDIMHALGVGPNDVGESAPYLSADAEHASRWRQRLGERSSPRIGVCWRGRTTNAVERMRSLHRTALERLLSHDAEFVSLQFEAGEDAVLLAAHGVADFGRDIADFAELAALIEVLDLVVTIDTGVAHLAGALGKPVWIMLPYAADWRWMKARADSPWYPSARLFRQTKPGDWNSVVDAVAAQLPK